jgi:hypothetical protein
LIFAISFYLAFKNAEVISEKFSKIVDKLFKRKKKNN